MKKIILNSEDWSKIQDAMFIELQKCGSCPSNRFLRMAFSEACKSIGIELEYKEQNPKNP